MKTKEKREQLQKERREGYVPGLEMYYLTNILEKTNTGKALHKELELYEDKVVRCSKLNDILNKYINLLIKEKDGSALYCDSVNFNLAFYYLVKYEYNITQYVSKEYEIFWGAGERFYTEEEVHEMMEKLEKEKKQKEEEEKRKKEEEEKNKPWYLKEIKYKTAPTLKEGFCIYLIGMLFCSIFYERVYGWIMCTFFFIWWCKIEIHRFNDKK